MDKFSTQLCAIKMLLLSLESNSNYGKFIDYMGIIIRNA